MATGKTNCKLQVEQRVFILQTRVSEMAHSRKRDHIVHGSGVSIKTVSKGHVSGNLWINRGAMQCCLIYSQIFTKYLCG